MGRAQVVPVLGREVVEHGPVTAKLCKTATKLAHVLPIMVAYVEQRESGRSGRSPCDPVADGSRRA